MYIKLYESILSSKLWKMKTNTIKTFLTILLKSQKYDNGEFKSGHCYISQEDLAGYVGVSGHTLTDALNDLINENMITKKILYNADGKKYGTEITIVNWSKYQTFTNNSELQVIDNHSTAISAVSVAVSSAVSVADNKYTINKENFSTTTTGDQPTEMVGNSFEEIKDYFQLRDVISRIQSFTNDKLDETAISFIKTKFFMIRNNSFTKKSGEIWDLLSFTNWLMKLLSEEGYTFNAKLQRPDSSNAKVFVPQNQSSVHAPFTKEELVNALPNERKSVIEELLLKYDEFEKKNWKTSKGNNIDISFFTNFLRNEIYKNRQLSESFSVDTQEDEKRLEKAYGIKFV